MLTIIFIGKKVFNTINQTLNNTYNNTLSEFGYNLCETSLKGSTKVQKVTYFEQLEHINLYL